MDLYPAIDLRDGQVVQLQQGDYDARDASTTTIRSRSRAASTAQGARWIHVVDLDAARDGGNANLGVIEAICANVSARVQTGGGVRSVEDASERFAAGVHRVVIGSAAVEQPEVVDELATLHPGQVAVGLDARGRDVAIHGWTDVDRRRPRRARAAVRPSPGVGALVVTEHRPRRHARRAPTSSSSRAVLAAVDDAGHRERRRRRRSTTCARSPRVAVDGQRLRGRDRRHARSTRSRFTVEEGIAACSPSA